MQELFPLLARYGAKSFNGPLKAYHFGELGMQAPQIESELFTRLFKNLPSDDYVNLMNEFPTIELEYEDSFYHWRVAGNNNKNIPLLDWEDSLGAKPSLIPATASFYMYFNEDFFNPNDIIVGNNPDEYYIRVISREQLAAGNWKYEVKLVTDDPVNKSLPSTELALHSLWSKETNFQPGSRSDRGTEAHFNTFIELKARAAKQRMQYAVDGDVIAKGQNKPLLMGFPDPTDPKNPKAMKGAFVNFYDVVARYQFRKQQARAFLFSQKNYDQNEVYYDIDGKNGTTIQTFSGMFKQIAATNVQPYSTINLDKIVDMTIEMGLAYKQDDQYYVVLETGAYGKKDISQWIEARAAQYTPNWDATRVKENGEMGGAGRTLTGVFTQFKSYNGVNIAVKQRPFFDDTERYKVKHSSGLGLNSSRNILVRDWVGEAGVHRLKVKNFGNGIFRYIPGMRDPFSWGGSELSKGALATNPVDGYEVHGMDMIGTVVKDPTKLLYMPYQTI